MQLEIKFFLYKSGQMGREGEGHEGGEDGGNHGGGRDGGGGHVAFRELGKSSIS